MNTKTKKIDVMPYNPDWPKMFKVEADFLKNALGDHCLAVHHIGSTSVPGLNAKEDLDVVCIVDQLSSCLHLESVGYVFKGEMNIPLRYYFSKNTPGTKVNLHVVEPDHGFIPLNLAFRDYLRAHDETRLAYANLKESLLQDPKNFERVSGRFTGYNLGKNTFIKGVLDQAGFNDLTINFPIHHQEWEDYHRICEQQIFNSIQVVYDRNHPTFTAENHYRFVLYKGTKIVSIAHVEFLNDQIAALRALATDTPYKKLGYATHMMQLVEKWVQHQGREVIKMHARPSAENFYRKLGYVNVIFDDPCIMPDYVDLGKAL